MYPSQGHPRWCCMGIRRRPVTHLCQEGGDKALMVADPVLDSLGLPPGLWGFCLLGKHAFVRGLQSGVLGHYEQNFIL